MFDSTLRNDN